MLNSPTCQCLSKKNFRGDARARVAETAQSTMLLDLFAPHMGSRLVEVCAGTGSFSEPLLEREPDTLKLVEPSARTSCSWRRKSEPVSL